jgi:hypothetical protein
VPPDPAAVRGLERVVAAGVEHQQADLGAAILQRVEDYVRADRLARDETLLALARLRRVDRQQVVRVADGDAVAGEEEERGVAAADLARELG